MSGNVVEEPGGAPWGEALIIIAIGAIIAMFGGFGTGDLAFGQRLAYWVGGLLAAFIVLQLLLLAARQVVRALGLHPAMAYLFSIPALTVIVTMSIAMLAGGLETVTLGLFVQIGIVACIIWTVFFLMYLRPWNRFRRGDGVRAASTTAPGLRIDPAADLAAMLPPGFGPIHALRVEDHYTIALSAEGQEMLLLPLRDAIAAMQGREGMQVHRSWWVAHDAVRTARKKGRNVELELVDGTRVPVSRANVAAAREAGWL